MEAPSSASFVALVSLSLFLAICLWRTASLLRYQPSIPSSPTSVPLTRPSLKLIFHISLTFNALFECLFYLTMLHSHGYTLLGYAFHLCGLYWNILTFAIIIFTWGKILQTKSEQKISKIFLFAMSFVNFVTTIIGIVYLVLSGSFSNYSDAKWSYLLVIFVNGISLLILSGSLLIYGRILRKKLQVPSRFPNRSRRERKMNILMRINLILGICSLCFFIRVLCVVIFAADFTFSTELVTRIPSVVWFLLSSCIPTIVPGLTLLYTQRTSLHNSRAKSHLPSLAKSSVSCHDSQCGEGAEEERGGEDSNQYPEDSQQQSLSPVREGPGGWFQGYDPSSHTDLYVLDFCGSQEEDEGEGQEDYLEWDNETGELLDDHSTGLSESSSPLLDSSIR